MAQLRHDHHIGHAEEAAHNRQVKIQVLGNEEHQRYVEKDNNAPYDIDEPVLGSRFAWGILSKAFLTCFWNQCNLVFILLLTSKCGFFAL